MSQIQAYEREPYRTELEVDVIAAGDHDGRPYAELDDTILYPEGGGQPADRGLLGGFPSRRRGADIAIVDVQRVGDVVRHYLDAPVALGPASLVLDWDRRFDHMQQHTAQHLLTAVAADRFGWQTTSFHLQDDVPPEAGRRNTCDVELDVATLSEDDLAVLEAEVNGEVRAGRAVTCRRVEPSAMTELAVRSRGLPAGHTGSIRLVEIEGLDLNTCGGTHLASTAEIECVKLLGVEPKRGGCLLRWIAGGRVRRRLATWEARGAELRRALGAGDDELAGIAALKLAQLKQTHQRQRALEGRLAEAVAEALAARSGRVVEAHFDDADMGLLQQIARRFTGSAYPGLALLTATGEQGAFFVVAAGGDCEVDLQRAGRRVAEALGGRGGGSGNVFQGKAESLAGRGLALAALADQPLARSSHAANA